jgi:uncharacterized repeat protein (TIGR03803 family)
MFRIRDISSKCVLGCGLALTMFASLTGAHAKSTETVLYSFCNGGNCPDGADPNAGLIIDQAGNLYGTTQAGGMGGCSDDFQAPGCGTVFEVTTAGVEKALYSFCAQPNCTDGAVPLGGLIADEKGNLFGTTVVGGEDTQGVIFKVSPHEKETVLYYFQGHNVGDGASPQAGLIADAAGNFYSTTQWGGDFNCNCGTVFKFTPSSGSETVLHDFVGNSDGYFPGSGLVMDEKGNLYGTTVYGGGSPNCSDQGCGMVFKVTPNGTETVLYAFQGAPDGARPIAGLILYKGNLYGTTSQGGAANAGTVFELSRQGAETVLLSFNGDEGGSGPYGGVIADKHGTLYGTTYTGGAANLGTVFKLAPDGKETVLHSFAGGGTGGTDGALPGSGLIMDQNGDLYGTTVRGGTGSGANCPNNGGCGTVFEITNK